MTKDRISSAVLSQKVEMRCGRNVLMSSALASFVALALPAHAQTIIDGAAQSVIGDGSGTQPSPWNVGGNLTVGNTTTGSLTISGGGAVTNAFGTIAGQAGSTGAVTVDGTGSTWMNAQNLGVGFVGSGTLTVTNGASVATDSYSYVGVGNSGSGTIFIDGAGSTLQIARDLTLGYSSGRGTLAIANGGSLSDDSAHIGFSFASGNTTVDGGSSTWTTTHRLVIGDTDSTGTLSITNGGSVSDEVGVVGGGSRGDGGTGTVLVDGTGSAWQNSGSLTVGENGVGALAIRNGGTVSSDIGVIGGGTVGNGVGVIVGGMVEYTATGTVTVDGAGSNWANATQLYVGDAGTGTLTVSNSGIASAAAIAVGAFGGTGTVNIGSASGETPVAPGTLEAPAVDLSVNGSLVFNHTSTNYSFSPTITGQGSISQLSGTTIITGDSGAFDGSTNVGGGTLRVDGALGASGTLLTVMSGGRLGGDGTIGSNVVISTGGALTPAAGGGMSTLNVGGNLSFATGSSFQVGINAAGQTDTVRVAGAATISGGTVKAVAVAGIYRPGSVYTILSAEGGRSGTFEGITINYSSTFITAHLGYNPNDVYIAFDKTVGFGDVGLTLNQRATGVGVDSLGPGNPIWDAIVQSDAASARAAFDLLSGEIHASIKTRLIEDSRLVRDAAFEEMQMTGPAGRWSLWLRGLGSWGRTDGDGNAVRLNRSTGGALVGLNGKLSDMFGLGIMAGYSRTSFDGTRGSGESDNYHLGAYGRGNWGSVELRLGAAYSWHRISTQRAVVFTGFSDRLASGYNAGTTQIYGELGYNLQLARVSFTPFANLAYVNLHNDGFTERGGTAALTGSRGNADATLSELGVRGSINFGRRVTAIAAAGWRHAYGSAMSRSSVSFSNSNTSFTIEGLPVTKNAAKGQVGLNLAISSKASIGAGWSGQFGSGIVDNSARASFQMTF